MEPKIVLQIVLDLGGEFKLQVHHETFSQSDFAAEVLEVLEEKVRKMN